jgi:hypothetical protein
MENDFSARMQSLGNDELMDVIIDKRSHYQPEALAAADREMYRRVVADPALSKIMLQRRAAHANPHAANAKALWKSARWGIMAFCIILFMYELVSKNYSGVAFVILLNFFAGGFIVKKLIAQGRTFGHPFVFGLFVSAMLLVVRFTFEMVYQAVSH